MNVYLFICDGAEQIPCPGNNKSVSGWREGPACCEDTGHVEIPHSTASRFVLPMNLALEEFY